MIPLQEESNPNPKSQYFVHILCHQMTQETEQQLVAAIIPLGDDKFRDVRRNHHPCSQQERTQHPLNARGRRSEGDTWHSTSITCLCRTHTWVCQAPPHPARGTASSPLAAHRGVYFPCKHPQQPFEGFYSLPQ